MTSQTEHCKLRAVRARTGQGVCWTQAEFEARVCVYRHGDLQGKLLTLAEAKKRKVDIVTQAKRQKLLVQAEQPKAIECAAWKAVVQTLQLGRD